MDESHASDEGTILDRIKALSDIVDRTGDRTSWDELIGRLRRAIELTPLDSANHGRRVMDLCSALGKLYQQTGNIAIWQQGLDVIEQWQGVVPIDDWRAPLYMLAQAILFYYHALTTDEDEDAQVAIRMLEQARSHVKWGSGVYCTASNLLANLRFQRFIQTGKPLDLEATIAHALDVIQAERAQPHERLLSLENLSRALTLRNELGIGSADALDAAVEFAQTAIELTPQGGDVAVPYLLHALALRQRFRHSRNPNDLDLAITSYASAIEASTDPWDEAGCMKKL
jgi:tetratricopeptide (TPR) repeat protein